MTHYEIMYISFVDEGSRGIDRDEKSECIRYYTDEIPLIWFDDHQRRILGDALISSVRIPR